MHSPLLIVIEYNDISTLSEIDLSLYTIGAKPRLVMGYTQKHTFSDGNVYHKLQDLLPGTTFRTILDCHRPVYMESLTDELLVQICGV